MPRVEGEDIMMCFLLKISFMAPTQERRSEVTSKMPTGSNPSQASAVRILTLAWISYSVNTISQNLIMKVKNSTPHTRYPDLRDGAISALITYQSCKFSLESQIRAG